MKKVVIYYNNDELLQLIDKVQEKFDFEILSILRTGERAVLKNYNNLSITAIDDFNENIKDCSIAVVLSEAPFVNQMYYDLFKLGIKEVYTLNAEYLNLYNEKGFEKIFTKFRLNDKPLIGYLETHVYNQCNLNCKGCTHFSNIDENKILDVDEYEQNIKLLSEKFNINTFRLMGGEPLLNSKLIDYINITRKYFPNSNIDIATNGLLLCSMDKKLIEVIVKNNIIIKISLYQPINAIKDKLSKFLKDNNIKHFYGNGCKQADDELLIKDFHKCLTLEPTNNEIYNSKYCFARECWFLFGTKISKCATPLLIGTLNKKYNTNYQVDENSYIDITKLNESSWEGINKLLQPMPFCKYCSSNEYKYPWDIQNKNQLLSDYVILEGEDKNAK